MKTAIGYKLFRVSKKYPGKLRTLEENLIEKLICRIPC